MYLKNFIALLGRGKGKDACMGIVLLLCCVCGFFGGGGEGGGILHYFFSLSEAEVDQSAPLLELAKKKHALKN